MNTQDLIIGHFEGTLDSTQESELQSLMNSSPEVRSLYEQHRSMNDMLGADATKTRPSNRLYEATLAAAMAMGVETITGGALSWLTGKVLATAGAVIIGGTAVGLIVAGGDEDETPDANRPAVTAPIGPETTSDRGEVEASTAEDEVAPVETPESRGSEPAATTAERPRPTSSPSATSSSTAPSDRDNTASQPNLLGDGEADANIEHDPTTVAPER